MAAPARALVVAAAGLVLLTGCTAEPAAPPAVTQGTSVAEPGPGCTPPPATGTALPAGFPVQVALPPGAQTTGTRTAQGFALATGRVPGMASDVLAHFREALPAAGLFVGRDEDERRGGELTFLGGSAEGSVTVATLRCPEGSAQFTLSARLTR